MGRDRVCKVSLLSHQKMSLFEIALEVILVLTLGIVAEVGGLAKLFGLMNSFLRTQPTILPKDLNVGFGVKFDEIHKVFASVLRKVKPISMTKVDPTFPQPEIQVIPLLIFSNVSQNEDLNALLKICDFPFTSLGLEMMTCGIQVIPPGVQTSFHQENYYGLLKYYLVLQGHEKASITIRELRKVANSAQSVVSKDQVHQLRAKSSLLFDSTVPLKVDNLSNQTVHILCCEFRRPFSKLPDIVNRIVMKIIAVSPLVVAACSQCWSK